MNLKIMEAGIASYFRQGRGAKMIAENFRKFEKFCEVSDRGQVVAEEGAVRG